MGYFNVKNFVEFTVVGISTEVIEEALAGEACQKYKQASDEQKPITTVKERNRIDRSNCSSRKIKKNPDLLVGALCSRYLSSRAVARQVLSAQVSLTSVFGMGTGGPSPQSIPTLTGWLLTILYINLFRLFTW